MIVKCNCCKASVDGQVISSYKKGVTQEDDYEYGLRDLVSYIFLKCPRCSSPFLVSQRYSNHSLMTDFSQSTLYPPENQVDASLPNQIRTAFEEALKCFEAQAFTASVILCRKTLEGICKEHSINNGNLKNKLEEMKNKGIIEQRLFEWADALRISGNDAAHDLDITFSELDAKDIVEFTKALLEYVFTFRNKFEQFMKRRKST